MKGEREVKNGVSEEEREVKRKRVMERSDSPPPPLGFNNPLLPFANAYDDDNNQQNKSQTRCNVVAKGEGNGNKVKGEAQVEVDDDEDDDDDASKGRGKHSRHVEVRRDCPYLDTVNRQVLDFDFERFCSVSLSNLNVYACLVCGKYFQGRSQKSHAYTHSLEAGHHVYINLLTEKVYCLPDSYEINDPSLDDIRHVLNPRFSRAQVDELDKNRQWSRALDGSDYLPGMVGLNNIQKTEFVNVTIQSLMRVTPLRNFFLIPENYQHCKSPLVHRFGELTRKIWHARNFKGQVSPHEFLQAVMKASKKRFRIGQQSDPVEFMSWLLNTLHMDLRTSKDASSIIHKCFQGELEVVKEYQGNENKEISRMPFLMLGLDLPPPPLFKDVMEATKVKLYDANPQILKAFSNTGIEFIIGLGNEYLSKMKDPSKALTWIKQNVTPFLPATNITCITIGNEILALNDSSLTTNLLPAMQGVHSALITAGLSDQISVTTAHSLSILKSSFPPSAGEFQPDLLDSLTPILEFHRKTDSPFLINAYPFFAYKGNPKEVPLDFVLFQPNQGIVDPATGFHYDNMLFAQIDAVYSALAAAGFKSLRVEISETGWPSKGDDDEVGATPENAKRYNGNLIKMMMSGKKTKTPLKPNNDLSIYVFALFNENLKPGPTSERNYGLFKPDGTQAYSLGFALNDVVRGASGGGTGGGNSSSGGGRDKSPVFPVSPVAPDSASTGYLAISASPVTGKRKGKGAILSLVVSMLLARHLL